MNSQKPNPGEGWRLLQSHEFVEDGDQFMDLRLPGKWCQTISPGSLAKWDSNLTYRRRIPAPADGWIDLKTVKPEPGAPIWVGRVGRSSAELCKLGVVAWTDLSAIGWTHWQPAIVPDPPKAPEPVKSKEEVAFGEWVVGLAVEEAGNMPLLRKAWKSAWESAGKANP